MPYRRTTAVQERLDATRSRIVEAAHDLVAAHGYAGCSVALVAEAAEVATGSVYRHFPDKGALFAEVFRTSTQREVEAVGAAAAEPGPIAVRLTRAVETFAHRALANPRLAYALIAEPVDPRIEAERLAFRRAWRNLFVALVAAAVADAELPPQDAEVSAAAVVGALAEALIAPLSNPTGTSQTHVVPDLTALVIRALGATPP
ncbi:MAG: TetR/AcrR family transcriptional regulator [Nocardioides sp.]